jgi:two-component system response regulator (stage 0 sporulation protein A)
LPRIPDEKRVAQVLKELCAPASLLGYYYLKSAILICLDNPEAIHSVTTLLYPAIAEAHGTTTKGVERATRNAIAYSINNAPVITIAKYLTVPRSGTVTNSMYIASIAEALRLEESDVD